MDQRAAMEMNFEMIRQVNEFCLEKTVSQKHNDVKLSSGEENNFKNCFQKYFASTQVFIQAINPEAMMQ